MQYVEDLSDEEFAQRLRGLGYKAQDAINMGALMRKAEWGSVNRRGAEMLPNWEENKYKFAYMQIMMGKVPHQAELFPRPSLDRRDYINATSVGVDLGPEQAALGSLRS